MELFDSFDMESLPLDIMKRENPWDISSIYDLAYFCCPECDYLQTPGKARSWIIFGTSGHFGALIEAH